MPHTRCWTCRLKVSELKRVLVTGAGGFIGRSSIAPLKRLGFEVHAVYSGAPGHAPTAPEGAFTHVADLLSEGQVDALLERVAPTHLLHFAWIATPGIYWHSPENFRWLAASENLLRGFRARAGIRAVMAGSSGEYDWSKAGVCSETSSSLADESAQLTPYAASKIALQKALAQFPARRGCRAHGDVFFFNLVPTNIRIAWSPRSSATCSRTKKRHARMDDRSAVFCTLRTWALRLRICWTARFKVRST